MSANTGRAPARSDRFRRFGVAVRRHDHLVTEPYAAPALCSSSSVGVPMNGMLAGAT